MDEFRAVYFEEMARGLALFEKIERLFDEIDFFIGVRDVDSESDQLGSRNYQTAAQLLRKLEYEVTKNTDTVFLLTSLDKLEEVRKRVALKRESMRDSILEDIK
jgi:hypothetical protein